MEITANTNTKNSLNMESNIFQRTLDEIRLLNVDIDNIIQGYINYWKEFDNNKENWMRFQKRIYIVLLRHLPKESHKELYVQLINEYQQLIRENIEIVADIKKRLTLEKQDIQMFEKWLEHGNVTDSSVVTPIDKEYQTYMQNILPTGTHVVNSDARKKD